MKLEASEKANIFLGIMTGTSLDAIDIAACRFVGREVQLAAFHSEDWSPAMRESLMRFAVSDQVPMDLLTRMHFLIAREFARVVENALRANGIARDEVRAIGMHGQTVRHLPNAESMNGFPPIAGTLQLGSGSALSALTGIDVVSDFRSGDVALGGQGAPLVPMFDFYFLTSDTHDRLIVNIGGIANVTWLPKNAKAEEVIAFDSGPGNMLLDRITQEHCNMPYDHNGDLARNGRIDDMLLQSMLSDPYYSSPPPKSTGREMFGPTSTAELDRKIIDGEISAEDALATITELTARTISGSLNFVSASRRSNNNSRHVDNSVDIIVSGGGALNEFLMERIQSNVTHAHVLSSDFFGIPSKAKEAIAFAFFTKAFLEDLPIHLPSTTGASRKIILGSLCKGTH